MVADLPLVPPVVLVAGQGDAARVPGAEDVRAGAHRVEAVGGHGLAAAALVQDVRMLGGEGPRRGHGEGREGQGLEEPGEGLGEVDPYAARRHGGAALVDGQRRLVRVGLEHALEGGAGGLLAEGCREVEPAVEVGADGGGVERRPVLERDLLAQLEGVGPAFIAL